jgi:hypothetical protein
LANDPADWNPDRQSPDWKRFTLQVSKVFCACMQKSMVCLLLLAALFSRGAKQGQQDQMIWPK